MAPRGPVTAGVDHNYFRRFTVGNSTFTENANAVMQFRTGYMNMSMINEGANTIEYSFNGTTVHGDLVPSTPSEALSFAGRNYNKVWFRAPSGSSTIRFEAWGE